MSCHCPPYCKILIDFKDLGGGSMVLGFDDSLVWYGRLILTH